MTQRRGYGTMLG